jgi:hypothetical protein
MRCVFKHYTHLSSIDVITLILRWCRIWCAACGTVWVSECAAGGFVVCLRVCVNIVWL